MNARVALCSKIFEQTAKQIPAEEIFRERAGARAILVEACVYDLHEAVDLLQVDAERTGLVDMVGQEVVQAIIAEAFARPQYVYRLLIGPVELTAWLAEQSTTECKSIGQGKASG
jgi:hypothetical protein